MHRDDDDLTAEFWGTKGEWEPRPDRPRPRPRDRQGPGDISGSIPAVRALRDGLAAFRPKRITGAADHHDRTREHGIVRPDARSAHPAGSARRAAARPRVPVADNDATLAELAGDWLDAPIPLPPGRAGRPAIYLDEATAPTPAVAARRPARRAPAPVDFDDLDEFAGYEAASEPDAWAEVRTAPLAARRWADRVGIGAVDPLLARLGTLVLITVMLVPLALAARGGAGDGGTLELGGARAVVAAAGAAPAALSADGATTPAAAAADAGTPTDAAADVPTPVVVSLDDVAAAEATATDRPTGQAATSASSPSTQSGESTRSRNLASSGGSTRSGSDASDAQAATGGAQAERAECGDAYTIVAGDSWFRIAEGADVPMRDLFAVNQANIDTVLLPGAEICLPVGAQTPPAPTTTEATPTTTEAPTTEAPTTTEAAATTSTTAVPTTTAAPTTAAPTTTEAPVTTTAGPSAPIDDVSTAEAQQIIREVWPDELEERALEVAFRESRWVHDADNGWCCVGLFQIYWSVHQSWLDDYGINSRDDLKDARKNVTAAYALYQRAGGWAPWGG